MYHPTIFDFNSMGHRYNKVLKGFGMNHDVGAAPLTKYASFSEFRDNLKAPVEIPIILLGTTAHAILSCLQSCALLAVNFATFDFKQAGYHGLHALNRVITGLHDIVRGIFDTLVSAVELFTRTAATIVHGVEEAVNSCLSPKPLF